MFERVRELKVSTPGVFGGGLVFLGVVLFMVVFFTLSPVLSDPVGTYDKWFPENEDPATVADEEEPTAQPIAAFRFVADAVVAEPSAFESENGEGEQPAGESEEGVEPNESMAIYRVTFEDRSEPGDADIAAWVWDFGDGNEAEGAFVVHTYEGPGVYPVRLDVEDENGVASKVEGDIEVPEKGRAFGRVEASNQLDLSDIESAVEDAVIAIERSIDDTLDGGVIVAIFALAAIATTVVAWRVTRGGVMLLRPDEKMRLKVKSAQIDIGKTPVEDLTTDLPSVEETTMLDSELVDV